MSDSIAQLEQRLNHFDPAIRRASLETLAAKQATGEIAPTPYSAHHNLHCHTFFSYNGYGYSPSYLAWWAKKTGLHAVGIVDFDVLDAVDEFLAASRLLGLRHCAGIETRIFLPEFETREINSPGEPGIAYHMGVGFTSGSVPDTAFLASLKETAQRRNADVIARVNAFVPEIALDLQKDVVPLTPNGNPTERHLCRAYDERSQVVFPDKQQRAQYWADKLKLNVDDVLKGIDDAPNFQGTIRGKLMKSGGPGYVKPEPTSFPQLKRFNEFVLTAGAIPTCAWLDGTTAGEKAMEELLRIQMDAGVALLNIIPDRNWNIKDPAQKAIKVQNLNDVIALAIRLGLPVIVGTEMNAYGQKHVDDFDTPELAQHMETFVEGANIVYAHTALQALAGIGYCSEWSKTNFATPEKRNLFYEEVGAKLRPEAFANFSITADMTPQELLKKVIL